MCSRNPAEAFPDENENENEIENEAVPFENFQQGILPSQALN